MMMFSKVWLINFILMVVFFSIAIQTAEVWKQEDQFAIQAAAPDPEDKRAKSRVVPKKAEPESAYDLIAEKSLFSEERTEFIPEIDAAETEMLQTRQSRQPVFLYGVVMVGDYRKALIQENADGSIEDRWVYEGDRVGGMTVKAIEKEKLFLASDSETVEVLLYDRGKPKKATRMAKTESPTIVTLSAADSSHSSIRKSQSEKSAEQEKSENAHTKLQSDAKDSAAPSEKPETQSAVVTSEDNESLISSPFTPNTEKNLKPNQGAGEYETIQTPFGKIQRKK